MTKGQRIRQKREELNIGQTELAQKVHISKQTLYKYENDIVTNIPSNRLEDIATALGTTPDYLMGWEDKDTHFTTLQNSPEEKRAKELFTLYKNTTPEIQAAVELLLRSSQLPSEFPEMK